MGELPWGKFLKMERRKQGKGGSKGKEKKGNGKVQKRKGRGKEGKEGEKRG